MILKNPLLQTKRLTALLVPLEGFVLYLVLLWDLVCFQMDDTIVGYTLGLHPVPLLMTRMSGSDVTPPATLLGRYRVLKQKFMILGTFVAAKYTCFN